MYNQAGPATRSWGCNAARLVAEPLARLGWLLGTAVKVSEPGEGRWAIMLGKVYEGWLE